MSPFFFIKIKSQITEVFQASVIRSFFSEYHEFMNFQTYLELLSDIFKNYDLILNNCTATLKRGVFFISLRLSLGILTQIQ